MCEHPERRCASSRARSSDQKVQGGIVTSRIRLIVLVLGALGLVAIGLATGGPALAEPRTSSAIGADIKWKQAQVAQIRLQLESMRSEVATLMAEYDRATNALDVTRQEAELTTVRLSRIDMSMAQSRAALDSRAVRMYKSGGLDMVELFLGTDSLEDLVSRLDFMLLVQRRDARLLEELRYARDESLMLQGQLRQREAQLVALQREADERRLLVEAAVVRQQEAIAALDADVVRLFYEQEAVKAAEAAAAASLTAGPEGGKEPPVAFDPNTVVSDEVYLASGSMDATSIQTWLDKQPGSLKSYSGPDHTGATKTAAQMIAEAAAHHGVNPKVILVTLQKEQSLITKANPKQRAYDWAMGCGKMDGGTVWRFQGFGNQIWFGAEKLMTNRTYWRPGVAKEIDGVWVYPTNASTLAQYRYTPHFKGVKSFWRLYWLYFGDPLLTSS